MVRLEILLLIFLCLSRSGALSASSTFESASSIVTMVYPYRCGRGCHVQGIRCLGAAPMHLRISDNTAILIYDPGDLGFFGSTRILTVLLSATFENVTAAENPVPADLRPPESISFVTTLRGCDIYGALTMGIICPDDAPISFMFTCDKFGGLRISQFRAFGS